MKNQTLLCFETFKREKEDLIKIESYKTYLSLLSSAELISEASAYMGLLKSQSDKETCRRGKLLFDELVERLESENKFVGPELRSMQANLDACLELENCRD